MAAVPSLPLDSPLIEERLPAVGGRAWYTVSVLTVCYTLSFIDRQILGLLIGPIKAEFAITDTQVGLLGGLGSGLIGHSQKMTVAARATAEKKTVGQRS